MKRGQSPRQGEGSYAAAGVDIDAAGRAVELIKRHAASTLRPEVLSDLGLFSALFQLSGRREPVLVSSVDGVGTKLKIACALDRHDTIGVDLVNHCVNDILTSGAEPLFFVDYIAMGKLIPERVESIVGGMARACRAAGCALVGGETAEMPGIYAGGDYDLVGFRVGVVDRGGIIAGQSIAAGDTVLGLPSSGLHTNGYSLVRKVFQIESGEGAASLHDPCPELGRSLGEELLEPHRCYFPLLRPALPYIKGMAHITGGGLIDNLPRVLPRGLAARLEAGAWDIPPIFPLIQQRGNIAREEMYRVFNMGVGMALICSPEVVSDLRAKLPEARPIGRVVAGEGEERVIIV